VGGVGRRVHIAQRGVQQGTAPGGDRLRPPPLRGGGFLLQPREALGRLVKVAGGDEGLDQITGVSAQARLADPGVGLQAVQAA
jgi:hypothetical protein